MSGLGAALLAAVVTTAAGAGAEEPAAPDDPSALVLEAPELEQIPGILGGPLSALPLLPGASPLLSPLTLSAFRGLQPATVGVFYDGVELPTASHLLAGQSMLQDASVERLTFHREAPPLEHAHLLGGSLELTPPTEAPGLHADATLDLLRLGALGHAANEDGTTRVTVGASVAWTPYLATRIIGGGPRWDPSRPKLRADLYDYLARAEHDFGATRVRLLAIGSSDRVASASDTDLLGVGVTFHRVDLRADTPVGGGQLTAGLTWGYDRLSAELGGAIGQSEAFVIENDFSARATWDRHFAGLGTVRAGADTRRSSADLAQLWQFSSPAFETGSRIRIADALISGAWAEALLGDDPRSGLSLGFRADDYHLAPGRDFVALEPRANAWHAFGDRWAAHASVALLHQPPTFLVPFPGVDLAALRFGLQEVLRTEAGVRWLPFDHTRVELTGWLTPVLRAIELSPLDRDFLQTVKGSPEDVLAKKATSGTAWGAELFVRRELSGGWFGWAQLSYQRSTREQQFPVRNDYGEPVAEKTASLPVTWDRAVTASVVAGRTVGAWSFSGAAQFHTGVPELGGLSSFAQREGLDRLRPGPAWIEADADQAGRLPPFFRLDVRVARAFKLGPVDLLASLDVQNVTFSPETTKYSYSDQADSLEDRARGNLRLVRRAAGVGVPAVPLPMIGLAARY